MINPMKFFWGLVIAGIGFLLLGINLNWWDVSISEMFWLLLPMILIVVGIRFIVHSDKLFAILALLVVLATGYSIVMKPGYVISKIQGKENVFSENINKQSGTDNKLSKMEMKLDIGAAKITVDSLDETNNLYSISTKNLGKIEEKYVQNNDSAIVTIGEEFASHGFNSKMNNRTMNAQLTKNVLTVLKINSGASKMEFDLSKLLVEELDLNSGASSGEIKFGSLVDNTKISIDTGASSLKLLVPKDSGLEIKYDVNGLNNRSFAPNIQLNRDGNTYTTPDYNEKSKKIQIQISAGVSNIEVVQY